MNRITVKSSDLKSVGYDKTIQTLEVEFHNGSIYKYTRVPIYVYIELMGASSIGSYFAKNIRDARQYSCTKIFPKLKLLRL